MVNRLNKGKEMRSRSDDDREVKLSVSPPGRKSRSSRQAAYTEIALGTSVVPNCFRYICIWFLPHVLSNIHKHVFSIIRPSSYYNTRSILADNLFFI